ncbi:hypothetical protein ABT093_19495 [Kitasatospora sp. NPDC002551]|uniref:hypothetical protein n=1 Tax=Kitasatospora sp. NPDC002551 TaxID=3154539 RepID=UPI0033225AEB
MPSPRANDETIPHEAPIFARLAELWTATGRTVPGRPDDEWQRLVAPPGFQAPEPEG